MRCIILLVPVIGNILIALYDFSKANPNPPVVPAIEATVPAIIYPPAPEDDRDRALLIAITEANRQAFEALCEPSIDQKKSMVTAVQQNGLALGGGSIWLKNDKEVVLAAVQQNGLALRFASLELKGNREVVFTAIQQNRGAIMYANNNLQQELRSAV